MNTSSPAVTSPSFSRQRRKRPVALATSIATLVASLLLAAPERSHAANGIWNAAPTNGNWVAGVGENNWNTGANTFPGLIGGTTSTDFGFFQSNSSTTNIVINNATLNIAGINFDLNAANFTIGSTAGNALRLTSGGAIRINPTLTAINAIETVNAPLIIQGAGGTYTFANDSANGGGAGAGTLNIGGAVSGGAAGATVLTLAGSNTNANTISGNISNGTATSLAITKNGAGTWVLTGTSTYSGGTTINAGTIAINNGSALGTGPVTVNATGTLLGTANATFSGNNVTINGATVAAATGTVLTLNSGNTGTVTMGPGNVTFGSAGNTGVVVIGNSAIGSTVLATPTITVAFGTLRNGGGSPSPLSFFTAFTTSTTVNAGARLDTNGFQTTVSNLLGAGTLTNDGAALGTFNIQEGNFSGVIQDGASATALNKTTAGTLILTGASTYTGGTTITAGTLQIGDAGGATGSIVGNVVNNGTLRFDRDNITFAGDISGTGAVNSVVTGTLTMTGVSSYTGGTTVTSGVLAINNGKALGNGAVNVSNGATLLGTQTLTFTGNNVILNNATVAAATGTVMTLNTGNTGTVTMGPGNVTFGSAGNTGVVVIGNNAIGSTVLATPTITVAFGTLRNGGGSPSPLSFFTAFTTSTTVNAGAKLDTNGFQTTISNLLGAGTLLNDGAALGTFNIQEGNFTGNIQDGAGVTALTKTTAGTLTFTGTAVNTYTGPTNINAGTVLLDNINATNAGISSTVVNIGDGVGAAGSAVLRNVGFGQNINDQAAITVNGDGLWDIAVFNEIVGSVAGTAGSSITLTAASSVLTTGGANTDTTFAGVISGAGGVVKQGTGTWTLTSANTYAGTTTINAGRVWAQAPGALGGAAGGATNINTGGILRTTGVLNLSTLNWGQGNLQLAPGAGTGDVFTVNTAGGFQNAGGGGTYSLDPTGLTPGTTFTLTNYTGATNFTVGQFSAQGLTANTTYQGTFTLNPTNVQFALTGATATGNIIQNSAPVGTPTFADFTVNGPVTTGGPTENNTVRTLAFVPGGSLTIFNTLFVNQGPVNLVGGSSLNLGTSPLGNATLSASQLNVLFGGRLSGNGTIGGNLINSGLVSPGNSPGKITVTGNYRQTSTGTLRIEIGGTDESEYDRLIVGGTAELDGTLELVRLNKFKLKRGDKITFLTAGSGVSGEFAHVSNSFTSDTILAPEIIYEDTKVSLELVRQSFEKYAADWGLTPNQRAVAGALDSVSADDVDNKALVYLDERKLDHLPGDFDKIAPEELTSMLTVTTAYANVQSVNLQRRTADVRAGSNGFNAAGLAMNGSGPGYSGQLATARPDFRTGAAGPTGKESKEIKDVTPAEDPRLGVFLSGTGEWVDVNGNGNARGFDLTTGGFTLGLDYRISPNFALGIAAGYAGSSVDLTNNGRVWVNGGKLGLYATYFTGGFYVDAAVNGGYNSFDTKRSALQGTARGSTDGGELNVLFGTGYDWKIGALSIGPTATFQYTYASVDGFTERGSLAPLNIAGQDTESLRSALGFKASYDWKLGGVIVRPEVRAAWQHEYGDTSTALTSSFASGAGNAFSVTGPQIGRDSLLLGAGVAVQWNERTSTYVYYDGELFRSSYDSHSVSGGVRLAF